MIFGNITNWGLNSFPFDLHLHHPGVYILTNSWPNGPGKKSAFKKEGEKIKEKKEVKRKKKGREREKEGKKEEKERKKRENVKEKFVYLYEIFSIPPPYS